VLTRGAVDPIQSSVLDGGGKSELGSDDLEIDVTAKTLLTRIREQQI
jgi:hypothetical protein